LLSNRADSLVTSVPSEMRNCAEPAVHLRSEISFLRTCKISSLISYILALLFRNVSLVVGLHGCEIACALTQIFSQFTIFFQGTLLVANFTNLCKHIDNWNKR